MFRGEELKELVGLCKPHTTIVLDEVNTNRYPSHDWEKALISMNSSTPGTYTPKKAKNTDSPSPPLHTSTVSLSILLLFFFPHLLTRLGADVNEDPVVLIDGLTKNFRLPGWRVCWVIGPKNLISALSQSGSFLDGGANHPLQVAALPLLDPGRVQQEKVRIQSL